MNDKLYIKYNILTIRAAGTAELMYFKYKCPRFWLAMQIAQLLVRSDDYRSSNSSLCNHKARLMIQAYSSE